MRTNSEVLIALKELRKYKIKNHTLAKDRRLKHYLDAKLFAYFIRNGYAEDLDEYDWPHGEFDDFGIGAGESLLSALHHDCIWLGPKENE